MKSKALSFIKNFSYTLTSNLVSLLVSALVVVVVPKLIGVEEYGYWQLYLFYSSYVGFMHFGWNDGIYLRYGGKKYKELDKNLLFSQFYMLIILQFVISIIIFIISNSLIINNNKLFIIKMTAICMIILNTRLMLLFVLQSTNRIKEYAQITMMGRILYVLLIVAFLLVGVREYKLLIVSDLLGKFISFGYSLYCCRDIVFQNISTFYFSFKETIENINVGIKLMFANIAGMLIIGVVRFGIEHSWDVATFGKVSLTLNISNLLMLFINAVGIVMFPILRRTDEKKLPVIYETMRNFLMVPLLGVLLMYYPLRVILSAWLPQYADSLSYMSLLFPMCVYEGKMALLINTYLKTLRKEKLMLKMNLISLGLSLVLTFIITQILENLNLAIVSIVILLAFRCAFAEIYLSNILRISIFKDIIMELAMTMIFMLTGWFINSMYAVWIYIVAYVLYLILKRNDINNTIKNVKVLMIT